MERGRDPLVLAKVDTLVDLAEDTIVEYHRVAVLGELPREVREVREIRKVAAVSYTHLRAHET